MTDRRSARRSGERERGEKIASGSLELLVGFRRRLGV
jgi:hypothetical protein